MPKTTSKIESSLVYAEIQRLYKEFYPDIQQGKMSLYQLFFGHVVPILPSTEKITAINFYTWVKKQHRNQKEVTKTLMEKEMDKTRQQFEVRQDVAEMMKSFIGAIKHLADDPKALLKSGIKMTDLYKIIREEEDRYKLLSLKERSENRADAQFAFMVSITRAGQLTDGDIEFLEEDVLHELIELKKSHGVYQLPGFSEVSEAATATEADLVVADEGYTQGFV